jgi:virulence-associated protein VagC
MVLQSKLFKSGNSKALRISKQLGFGSDNVIIKKIDNGILVIEENKKDNFWNKWWNSFEKTDLERMQGKQEREDIF